MSENKSDTLETRAPPILEPRPAFTLFDVTHLVATIYVAYKAASITAPPYGLLLGLIAFIITTVVAFFVLGFFIGAFVLVLFRCWPRGSVGYEAACYVLTHFKQDGENGGSFDVRQP